MHRPLPRSASQIASQIASLLSSLLASLLGCVAVALPAGAAQPQAAHRPTGEVVVSGKQLLRDGRPWIPHGFYQIAFEVPPTNFPNVQSFWAVAYNNYTPAEYTEMKAAGADSVRIQIAQVGADPDSPLRDDVFFAKALRAIHAARAAGLTVIVTVQDETHVLKSNPHFHDRIQQPTPLPDDATRRVWKKIAPEFAHDRGVLFELLNEPRPAPSPESWQRWRTAMTRTLQTVRDTGAVNVVIAGGLGVGQTLRGAPLLDDPQVAYSSHPYALAHFGETEPAWQAKFGNFSHRAPVIITEWGSGGFFCDNDVADSSVQFLQYLHRSGIGLEIGSWDWPSLGFGSAVMGFPHNQFSTFIGTTCGHRLFGIGETVETWYRTGTPATHPE